MLSMRAHNGDIAEQSKTSPGTRAAVARGGNEVHPAKVTLLNGNISVPQKPF